MIWEVTAFICDISSSNKKFILTVACQQRFNKETFEEKNDSIVKYVPNMLLYV